MNKNEVLMKVAKNEITLNRAYDLLYKTKVPKKARFVKLKIKIKEHPFVSSLLKTLFILPVPVKVLKFFLRKSDQVISESIPIKIKDLLNHGLYKEMCIEVEVKDEVSILIKTV